MGIYMAVIQVCKLEKNAGASTRAPPLQQKSWDTTGVVGRVLVKTVLAWDLSML